MRLFFLGLFFIGACSVSVQDDASLTQEQQNSEAETSSCPNSIFFSDYILSDTIVTEDSSLSISGNYTNGMGRKGFAATLIEKDNLSLEISVSTVLGNGDSFELHGSLEKLNQEQWSFHGTRHFEQIVYYLGNKARKTKTIDTNYSVDIQTAAANPSYTLNSQSNSSTSWEWDTQEGWYQVSKSVEAPLVIQFDSHGIEVADFGIRNCGDGVQPTSGFVSAIVHAALISKDDIGS
ncbi:MAG: hypothetical protein IPJ88_08440 [Myxococcales bacterium]|nr:MAG: hypothetical protein IPJ88_08440 [Myxococcales bacterium]